MQGLKEALHFCGIVRQAYHGWTFIGNHVHNASKKSSSSCKCTNYYSIDSIEVYSVPEYNLITNQEYTATDSQTTAAVTDTAPKVSMKQQPFALPLNSFCIYLQDATTHIANQSQWVMQRFISSVSVWFNSYCSQSNYNLHYKTTILCRYKGWHISGILLKLLSRCHHYPKAAYAQGPYGPRNETLA